MNNPFKSPPISSSIYLNFWSCHLGKPLCVVCIPLSDRLFKQSVEAATFGMPVEGRGLSVPPAPRATRPLFVRDLFEFSCGPCRPPLGELQ